MQNLLFVTQNLFNRGISRFSALLFLAVTLAVLEGCGSGQAIPQEFPVVTPTTGPAVASIQLLASSTQIASSGANTVDLTAIVLTSTRQTISGKLVTFSTGAPTETAFVNNISASGISDVNGIVTAKLNLGGNKSNRTITVSATADSTTGTNNIDVTGTTISISGNGSLAFGASTTLTLSAKDSAGAALPNMTVNVTSLTGNTIALTPASGITNAAGQITASVTSTQAGNDTITATITAAKVGAVSIPAPTPYASATQTLTISSASFAFTTPTLVAPATTIDIPLNTPTTVSVNWKDAGVAQVNKAVTFSASRGTVAGTPSTTNAAGDTPGVTISSTTAGPSIITASGPGGTPAVTLDVVFVATSAASATVQAIPGTVQVTTGSAAQTNNSATITTQVRDAANNLVKNAGVSFTITTDPSGGRLTSSSGTTDVSGSTSVTYVAGGTSSAQNGVTISATVNSIGGVPIVPVVTGTTNLTVAGQSLLVRLGTDNLVGGAAPTNTKTYVAIVTDASGNPVVGSTVQFALRPGRYSKGIFVADLVAKVWNQVITVTCPNRDLNFNGILDPGEDAGILWIDATGLAVTPYLLPGAVAAVNATGITDANGVATARITYPKDHSYWSEVTLQARTSVTSNDPPTQVTFYLPGPAVDYNNILVPPPGNPSPYGFDGSCFDLL